MYFYVKSDNVEIRLGYNINEIITRIYESFLNNYQKEEQILRNGSNYLFESVDILGIHFHNIKLKRGSSYIEPPKWILHKRATKNPKNTEDNKCFQYAITVASHHQNVRNHPERISNITPFLNNYNWKDINFPARIDEYKQIERNNKNIALNILSGPPNKEEINVIYKSSHIRKHEKQVILLMITDNEQEDEPDKWYYLAFKSELTHDGHKKPIQTLSRLFTGIASNNNEDFYCLGCLHSFRSDNALRKHERLCDNHDYYGIDMPSEDENILKYNQSWRKIVKSGKYNLYGP